MEWFWKEAASVADLVAFSLGFVTVEASAARKELAGFLLLANYSLLILVSPMCTPALTIVYLPVYTAPPPPPPLITKAVALHRYGRKHDYKQHWQWM